MLLVSDTLQFIIEKALGFAVGERICWRHGFGSFHAMGKKGNLLQALDRHHFSLFPRSKTLFQQWVTFFCCMASLFSIYTWEALSKTLKYPKCSLMMYSTFGSEARQTLLVSQDTQMDHDNLSPKQYFVPQNSYLDFEKVLCAPRL